MVENIYRHLSAGEYAELPLKERILRACREVERPLFFSTAIMVCAFIPLFTMRGPEGQLFGPMADTYAFALGGALLMAVMLAPVLCLLLFRNFKPIHDNFLVRFLSSRYLIAAQTLSQVSLDHSTGHGLPDRAHGMFGSDARPGVHAPARRGQPVDHGHCSR